MAEWFVVRKGKEHGPFQDAQLKSLATSGKLKEEDQVRRSDQKSTVAAKSIGGLFGPALSLESPPPAQKAEAGKVASSFLQTGKSLLFSPWVVKPLAVFIAPLGIPLVWFHPTWRKRQKALWIGVSVLCFALFGAWGAAENKRASGVVAEANALWDRSEKTAALVKYRQVLVGSTVGFVSESDRPTVFQRVIEAECESGNTDAAKKLIQKAKRFNVPLSFSSPVATRVLSQVAAEEEQAKPAVVKGTRDQPESLTADFLPHRAGLRQQRLTTAMLGLPMESQSRREYVHDGRGTITVNTLSNFYTKNRGAKPPQQTPKKEHYKIEDGFVCVGAEQIGNTIDWRKVLKLGAVQGDTWEDDGSGSPTRYEVVGFEKKTESMRELAPKGWQWVATIQSSEMLGDKEYQTTYLFAHGVGLIEKHVYEGSGGNSVKRSDEVLVPAIKE